MGMLVTTPQHPGAPATPSRALESRLGRSEPPFLPSLPFFLHHSYFRLKLCSQGLLKSPSSNLPWGGSGDRVRLVNSAGVSSRWEGTLGTEAQRSHIQRGHGKGPTRWLPAQLPRLLCVALWAFASSFLLLLLLCLVLTVGPAPCLWWKGQPFIVG